MDFRADDKSREFPVIIRGKPGDYTGVKTFSWTQQGEGNVFIRTEEESR